MSNILLPPGFCDLTGASAKKHFFILKYCIEHFNNAGYELVLPSLFEYNIADKDEDHIKVVDPINNQVMAMRNDITAQISRIWHREGSKTPQKFCYYGDVIYRQKKGTDRSRKMTQTGIEYIVDDNLDRDIEILKIVLQILSGLKLNDFSILISCPNLFNSYCKLFNITKQNRLELEGYLIDKNITAIKESEYSDLAQFIIPGSFSLQDIKIKHLEQEVESIQILTRSLKETYPGINIIIDPFDIKQYSYHTDFVFSVISHKLKKTIARGGSYNISDTQSAVGSSFYIEELSLAI